MALAENVTDMSEYRIQRNQDAHAIELLVLTADDSLLASIRESSTEFNAIHHALTLEQAGKVLSEKHVGVVVIDAGSAGSDIKQLIHDLNQQSEMLVSLVVGHHDDDDLLMDLVEAGSVYRFLLQPLSSGRVRIAIDVCVKQHLHLLDLSAEREGGVPVAAEAEVVSLVGHPDQMSVTGKSEVRNAGERSASSWSDKTVTLMVAIVVSLLLIAGIGVWWLLSSDEQVVSKSNADSKATGNDTTLAITMTGKSPIELKSAARDARDAGLIYRPPGRNALELYHEAGLANPADVELQQEFSTVVNEAMGVAQAALVERRADVAATVLKTIALVDPDNSRLSFLSAQLEQMHFGNAIDAARAAIKASRFDDAERYIDKAYALNPSVKSDLGVVVTELEAARNALLKKANARIAAGKLVTPRQDSARYYYELMLKNNPDNTTARQGLSRVASMLISQARSEIKRNRLSHSEALLADARKIDSSNRELRAAANALSDARARVTAKKRRDAEARKQAQREAQILADQQQVAESPAPIETQTVGPQPELRGSLIPVSELDRERYVKPRYPTSLEQLRVSGWVNVTFTVDTDGTTTDIVVQASSPDDVFDKSVISAVERWEFEPVEEDGVEVVQRTGVRFKFAPGDWKTGVGTITEF